MSIRTILIAATATSLASCSPADSDVLARSDQQAVQSEQSLVDTSADEQVADEARPEFDEDKAREDAEQEVADEGYAGSGATYGCTDDCSGHEAGFAYAQDYGDGSDGESQSFDEGRHAYEEAVDERVEEKQTAYDDGENDQ